MSSWRSWHRPLVLFAGAMAVMTVVSAVGLIFDDRVLAGAAIWFKPFKFAVSFVVYALALAWMLTLVTRGRMARLVGRDTGRTVQPHRNGDHHRPGDPRQAEPLQPRHPVRRDAVQRDGRHRRHPVDQHAGRRDPADARPDRRPRLRLGDPLGRAARPGGRRIRFPDDPAHPRAAGGREPGRRRCDRRALGRRTGRWPVDAAHRLVHDRRRSAHTALHRDARAPAAAALPARAGLPGPALPPAARRTDPAAAGTGVLGGVRGGRRAGHLAGAARPAADPPGRCDAGCRRADRGGQRRRRDGCTEAGPAGQRTGTSPESASAQKEFAS